MNTLAIAALVLSALHGVPAQAVETRVSEDGGAVGHVAETWTDMVLESAGVKLPAGTIVGLTNDYNCGAQASPVGLGGCTLQGQAGPIVVVSPQLENTELGVHILLHEAGHASGLRDECEAEWFAHDHGSNPAIWAYPECDAR